MDSGDTDHFAALFTHDIKALSVTIIDGAMCPECLALAQLGFCDPFIIDDIVLRFQLIYPFVLWFDPVGRR